MQIKLPMPSVWVLNTRYYPLRVTIKNWYRENLAFLKDDLEGKQYTDNYANVVKWGFFEYMSLEDIANKLDEYDLIIPF